MSNSDVMVKMILRILFFIFGIRGGIFIFGIRGGIFIFGIRGGIFILVS